MHTRLAVAGGAVALIAMGAGLAAERFWPRGLPALPARSPAPVIRFEGSRPAVVAPGRELVADVGKFDDELFAYLMFGYLRGLVAQDGHRAWLTYERKAGALSYVVRVAPVNDLIAGLPYLFELRETGVASEAEYRFVTPDVVARYATQSQSFETAYSLEKRRRIELLPRAELVSYLRRFIRFKAATDGRVRRRVAQAPTPPGRAEAHRLAEDIVTVADFYGLPLEFFLGIGAMENNYMDAKGDLGHAVWKRRPAKGDVILRRGPRGVLVLNESSGVWQITRETLRYAHRLFLNDTGRDYAALPEHLRPPREFDMNDVRPEVLTTYAGLFFRDLLDRFNGDVAKAVGAYNGGPLNPNSVYEAGVRQVAEQARRVLEQAAALQGRPAAGMQFLTRAR